MKRSPYPAVSERRKNATRRKYLNALDELGDGCTAADIALKLRVKKDTARHNINKLTKEGYILRDPCSDEAGALYYCLRKNPMMKLPEIKKESYQKTLEDM